MFRRWHKGSPWDKTSRWSKGNSRSSGIQTTNFFESSGRSVPAGINFESFLSLTAFKSSNSFWLRWKTHDLIFLNEFCDSSKCCFAFDRRSLACFKQSPKSFQRHEHKAFRASVHGIICNPWKTSRKVWISGNLEAIGDDISLQTGSDECYVAEIPGLGEKRVHNSLRMLCPSAVNPWQLFPTSGIWSS